MEKLSPEMRQRVSPRSDSMRNLSVVSMIVSAVLVSASIVRESPLMLHFFITVPGELIALAVMSGLRVKPFTLSATGRSQVPSRVGKESVATLSESQATGLFLDFPPPHDARAAIAMANNNNFFTIKNYVFCYYPNQLLYCFAQIADWGFVSAKLRIIVENMLCDEPEKRQMDKKIPAPTVAQGLQAVS